MNFEIQMANFTGFSTKSVPVLCDSPNSVKPHLQKNRANLGPSVYGICCLYFVMRDMVIPARINSFLKDGGHRPIFLQSLFDIIHVIFETFCSIYF